MRKKKVRIEEIMEKLKNNGLHSCKVVVVHNKTMKDKRNGK